MTLHLKSLTVPSKTFVFGEYAVLNGGPALIFASKPQFRIIRKTGEALQLHPESPAGRYLMAEGRSPVLEDLIMIDPHQGRGGFGGSTAEFLAAYAEVKGRWRSAEEVWRAYRDSCHAVGLCPSGADLVAQVMGGLTLFKMNPFAVENVVWPFTDIEVLFVRTGSKVRTHEHLRDLSQDLKELHQLADALAATLKSCDKTEFCRLLNLYQQELERIDLLAECTQHILTQLRGKDGLLVAKGCGAMGADVVMLILEQGFLENVKAQVLAMGLRPVATLLDECMGASVEWVTDVPEVNHVV